MRWPSHVQSVLCTEIHAVRNRKLDLNPADLTRFTFPLVLGLAGVLAFGAVPLIVTRSSVSTDDMLVPLLGSLALTAVGTAVMTWLIAIVVSGLVLVVVYRTAPTTASRLVIRTVVDSFDRVSDTAARLATLALVAGLVALAIGLPTRPDDELAHPVINDLLTAQIGVLLAALGVAYLAETVRCAAELVDRQSLLLAWSWSLGISCVSLIIATSVGPFQTSRMLAVLLNEWLPATVDGTPRTEVIADLLPAGANWWAAFALLPVITAVWAHGARRHDGFATMREHLAGERARPPET